MKKFGALYGGLFNMLLIYTSRILSLADRKEFEIYNSPIYLTIAFCFAEKKNKAGQAKEKIQSRSRHINIAEVNKDFRSKKR